MDDTFAGLLRRLRKAKGLTQIELARRARLSSVAMIESGRSGASVAGMRRLAKALDVDIALLLAEPPRRRTSAAAK